MRPALALAALLAAACAEEPAEPSRSPAPACALHFTDVTGAAGLDFEHDPGFSAEKQLPETMGAGAALADLDEDGDLDLYLVQSGPLPLAPDRSGAPPNRTFLNDGAGRFADATAQSGDAAHRGYGMGVAAGDVDGDGHLDLYVTNLGPDVLLRGDGKAHFTDVTAAAGIADERWNAGALLFDPDDDGDLDLYVTAYLAVDLAHPVWCGERRPGWRSYCHPDQYAGILDRYWRNRGDGRFEDATVAAGLADSAGKGLGALAADFDADGDVDLYVANDSVENRMWWSDGAGGFEDGTLLSGTGVNGYGMSEAGMGLAAGDVDGDGGIDLYVTNFDDESNTLYRADGEGLYTDVTALSGLEGPSRLPVGFGVVMEDLDGDGDLDLAVANGHIIDNIHLYHDGKSWRQRPLLLANDGAGRFRDATAQSGAFGELSVVGRGLCAGDLDGDGDPDLVLTECGGPARILRNDAPRAEWASFGGLPPGTTLELELTDGRRLVRVAGPAPSYLSSSGPDTVVGLDGARVASLRAGRSAELVPEAPLGPGRYLLALARDELRCTARPQGGER